MWAPIWAVAKGLGAALGGLAGFVPGWVWVAALAGMGLANCATGHQRDTARTALATLRADVAQTEATRSEIARLAEAGRRASELTHAASLAAITQRTNDENTRLAARVQQLTDSLRNRTERPAPGGAGVPGGATGALACTGAQLYRSDAAFLAGEAARADRLRIQLADCQQRHDAAVTLTGGWARYRQALTTALNPPPSPPPQGTTP